MKDIDKTIENKYELLNTDKVIDESENLIKTLEELIEKTKEIKTIKTNVHLKMKNKNGFKLDVKHDGDEAMEKIREYKEILFKVDKNFENLTKQINSIKIRSRKE